MDYFQNMAHFKSSLKIQIYPKITKNVNILVTQA